MTQEERKPAMMAEMERIIEEYAERLMTEVFARSEEVEEEPEPDPALPPF